jgi:hypothetical protein
MKLVQREKTAEAAARSPPTLHFHDEELVRKAESDRRLTFGLLIFCFAFFALVFQAGFKKV